MKPRLTVVPQAEEPAAERVRRRIKADKPASMLECRCGSREMIETRTGVLFKNGRPTGGTKQLMCASCLSRGERVVVA